MTEPKPLDREKVQEHFSDILSDVDNHPENAIRVMQAFEDAIISWMQWHEESIEKYKDLHALFLHADLD